MKGDNIADRLLDLAVACLRMAAEIEDSAVGKHIARQVTRSSTSGGANYEEARSAESSADFVHKIGVAGKEVSETVYWLKVTSRASIVTTLDLARWIDEGEQLVRILGASARTARNKGVALVGRDPSTRPE
jgi:four helix bundle protein